jgi:hypothetical protein
VSNWLWSVLEIVNLLQSCMSSTDLDVEHHLLGW